MHDSQHHISLAQNIGDIHMIRMSTSMNNSIHIEIEMVKLGQQRCIRNDLVDLRIAFRDPSVKLLVLV
jgi:hypothetical protein